MVLNINLYYSYNVISSLFTKFGLIMEYGKTKVFHFSRLHGVFNPPLLDLIPLGGHVLHPRVHSSIVKIIDGRLHFLFFSFLFSLFFFLFHFHFLFLETAQVRVCLSRCHISHKLMV